MTHFFKLVVFLFCKSCIIRDFTRGLETQHGAGCWNFFNTKVAVRESRAKCKGKSQRPIQVRAVRVKTARCTQLTLPGCVSFRAFHVYTRQRGRPWLVFKKKLLNASVFCVLATMIERFTDQATSDYKTEISLSLAKTACPTSTDDEFR